MHATLCQITEDRIVASSPNLVKWTYYYDAIDERYVIEKWDTPWQAWPAHWTNARDRACAKFLGCALGNYDNEIF